jgi:2-C-methyl-D-erythritol 2,4-cyclodiphosphate synthase
MQFRIGHGFDVHAFGPGSHVVIGGVRIPHAKGIVAHSDGDTLVHAMCDALLGAAALGNIGQYFPDTSEEFRGADSRGLLRQVVALLIEQDYAIINVDNTIVAQAPKMASHIPAMRANLSEDLNVALDQVSVKATTTESLGYIGQGDGLAAYSVALLCKGTVSR